MNCKKFNRNLASPSFVFKKLSVGKKREDIIMLSLASLK